MPSGILFLILPESSEATVTAFVRDLIVPDKRGTVKILNDTGISASRDMRNQTTALLIERISAYPAHPDNRLLIHREARCSIVELTDWWRDRSFGKLPVKKLAPAALKRATKDHLEISGHDWRTHALVEIGKFEGPPGNLDAWLEQFGLLGYAAVGRKVAAKLRVLRSGDLPGRPFSLRAADLVGQRQIRCYVQDEDAGGSWLEMQAILTHSYPAGTVFPVQWNAALGQLTFPNSPADEFVLYEDGLWSGHEAVGRLRAIANAPPPVPLVFRFGVVTDLGLMVTRHAIRSFGLSGKVSVDASSSEIIRFLGDDLPEPLHLGLEDAPEDYFAALHRHVKPYAFAAGEDWTDDEVEFCRTIGAQLTGQWLSQGTTQPPKAERVELFALGGGRFASTIVFSRSVPKVCLPLLWLDGTVTIGDQSVMWRPLFVDARRISDSSLLHPLM